ncbi:ATPase, T2SS/T4P/T4SS family [Fangia hongkongensis]|uniref:ATPase, T2SS/T4P/T4SS family n=1 Tax=Fangia hongkongensis TaxID=270495 RepID=UPI00036F7514|nr:ATPase, T2SS/T4P/T4SS family [Fangia hongkongensis]MBK2124450.1 Flp pilus assembly complex ATPase component TadA [Fangia hongkongensis]
MLISQLSEVRLKPNKLLFEDTLTVKDKPYLACYESTNDRFVTLITQDKKDDEDISNCAKSLRIKASDEYGLHHTKTYYVKPCVLTEVRNKVTDGKVLDHEKLRREFDQLLTMAIQKDASDIHIFAKPLRAYVMLREYGELRHYQDYDFGYINALLSAIYNDLGEESSKDSEFTPHKIQETVIERFIDHKKYRIRFASIPIVASDAGMNNKLVNPFKATLRILPIDRPAMKDFSKLGYRKDLIKDIERSMIASHGLGIISGAVNEGKSTTLTAMMEYLVKFYPHKHIVTIESPVENFIHADTVAQHPVHTSVDKSEAELQKLYKISQNAALRSDINIVCQNEIRNEDTAKFSQLIVQSGHLFLSTVHAQSALNIVNRLEALGVERDILCSPSFIKILIHQALLQKLCPSCKIPYDEFDQQTSMSDFSGLRERLDSVLKHYQIQPKYKSSIYFRNHQGCSKCSKGIIGQTVVAEIVQPSSQLIALLAKKEHLKAYIAWREGGGINIKEDGILKVVKGEVCASSLEMKLGAIDENTLDDLVDMSKIKSNMHDYLQEHPISKLGQVKTTQAPREGRHV